MTTQDVYNASSAWVVPAGVVSIRLLKVGGGGGGGCAVSTRAAGGGGAGGVVDDPALSVVPGETLTITVGAGGAAATPAGTDVAGVTGGNTTVVGSTSGARGVTALGGGGGGPGSGSSGGDGLAGGSGGGGGCRTSGSTPVNGGGGTAGQGNAGGPGNQGATSGTRRGGGGGGASQVGLAGGAAAPDTCDGGDGIDLSATYGTSVGAAGLFGGGGGGGNNNGSGAASDGGTGGGGNGANIANATAGAANTGGGGGGGTGSGTHTAGAGGSGVVIIVYTLPVSPGVPTSVVATPSGDEVALTWAAPATGDPATGYDVRIDGGAPTDVGLVLAHDFTGLTSATAYTVSVRAYNAAGDSAWVDVATETLPVGPDTAYAASVRVGPLSFSVEFGDVPDPEQAHVLAGVTFDWSAPDNVGWPPAPWNMPFDTISLRIAAPDADLVSAVRRLDVVRFSFTPEGYDFAEPLIDFAGLVTAPPKITRRPAGGVFLDVAAVDWRSVLPLITVFGLDATDGGEYNQETGPGFWHVAVPDYGPVGLMRGLADVETPEDPSGNPWGGVYRWIDDALDLGRGLPWLTGAMGDIIDPAVDDFAMPPVQNLHVDYEFGDDLVTLDDVYKTLGIYPMPVYDAVTGDLEEFHWIYVAIDGNTGNTLATLNAGSVLGEVVWHRGYVPDIVDVKFGGSSTPYLRHWSGEDVGETEPEDPESVHRISYAAQRVQDFNLVGFAQEKPIRSGWGLYKFEVLAYLEPTLVAGWFTYPSRVLTVVKIENIEPDRDPTDDGYLIGRLSRATFRLDASGRWTVTGRLRPRLAGPVLDDILADL